jgi:hypothetical protein
MEITAPMAVASKWIDDFLQTLQSPTQRTLFKRDAESFLSALVKSYCEQKSIEKAKGDVSYCPKNCKVKVPFQPTERVSRSAAYQALVAEAADVTLPMSKTVTDLYLRCRILNYEDRKLELIEFFAKTLSRFAELIIVECGLSNDAYDKFDLVADTLFHKFTHFAQALGTNLKQFAEIFRAVNQCGRPPKTITALMNEYFPNREKEPESTGQPKDANEPNEHLTTMTITQTTTPPENPYKTPQTTTTPAATNETSHKTSTTTPRSTAALALKGAFITAAELKSLKDTLAHVDTNNPDDIANVTNLLNRFYGTMDSPNPSLNPVSLFLDTASRSSISSIAEDTYDSLEPAPLYAMESFCKRISSVDTIRTHQVHYERPFPRTIQLAGSDKNPHYYSQRNFPHPPHSIATHTAVRKLFDAVNNCFFLPKKLYIQQDTYNDREQALMKVTLQQGLEETAEQTATTLFNADLTDDGSKLWGASIDQKISRLDEESKKRLQSFEDRLEENTNKRLKRIEELIANISKPTDASTSGPSKGRGGPPRGAQQKKSNQPRHHPHSSNNRSWNRNGQGGGRGRGPGRNHTAQKTVTFNMARNQIRQEDSLTTTQQPVPPRPESPEVIFLDNGQDSTDDGWIRYREPSDSVPPSSLNGGWGR